MGKVLHKLFRSVVNELSEALPTLVESSSEIYYFVQEPRNFTKVTILSEDIRKPWLKATMKEINNLIKD